MKHRYRNEDGVHLATIEKDGQRLDVRECDTKTEALALRDAASMANASSFDGIEVHVEEEISDAATGETVKTTKRVGRQSDKRTAPVKKPKVPTPEKPKGRHK